MKIVLDILSCLCSLMLGVVVADAFIKCLGKWLKRNWRYAYHVTISMIDDKGINVTTRQVTCRRRIDYDNFKSTINELESYLQSHNNTLLINNLYYLGRVKPEKKEAPIEQT